MAQDSGGALSPGLAERRLAEFLGPMIVAGLVATCGVIEFELGWATRSGKEFEELRADGGRRRVNAVGRQ